MSDTENLDAVNTTLKILIVDFKNSENTEIVQYLHLVKIVLEIKVDVAKIKQRLDK